MEDIFTLLLLIFIVYIIYQYGYYKKLKNSYPCKVIYKIKEEKIE